jgi:hypothetical protein
MREEPQPGERAKLMSAGSDPDGLNPAGSSPGGLNPAGLSLARRFYWAMALYGILAALAWLTIGEGKVLACGRPVEMRLVPLVVIGGLVVRTVLARQAEKIRHSRSEGATDEGAKAEN